MQNALVQTWVTRRERRAWKAAARQRKITMADLVRTAVRAEITRFGTAKVRLDDPPGPQSPDAA